MLDYITSAGRFLDESLEALLNGETGTSGRKIHQENSYLQFKLGYF